MERTKCSRKARKPQVFSSLQNAVHALRYYLSATSMKGSGATWHDFWPETVQVEPSPYVIVFNSIDVTDVNLGRTRLTKSSELVSDDILTSSVRASKDASFATDVFSIRPLSE